MKFYRDQSCADHLEAFELTRVAVEEAFYTSGQMEPTSKKRPRLFMVAIETGSNPPFADIKAAAGSVGDYWVRSTIPKLVANLEKLEAGKEVKHFCSFCFENWTVHYISMYYSGWGDNTSGLNYLIKYNLLDPHRGIYASSCEI